MPKSKSKARAPAATRNRPRQSRPASTSYDDVVGFYSGSLQAFRLPDTVVTATALMPMVEDKLVASNATGEAAVGFAANLSGNYLVNTVTAGTLGASWTGTSQAQYTTLTSNAARARQTGWRITVRYTGPAQTASGMMYVGTGEAFFTNVVSAPITNYTPTMFAYPIVAGGTWTFYVPMNGVPDFEPLTTSAFYNYWNGLFFMFTGLPNSSSYVNIRSERSVEFIPEPQASTLCVNQPEPYDPIAMQEAGVLSGSAPKPGSTSDDSSSWATLVGDAAWGLAKATTRVAVNVARQRMSQVMLQGHRIPMIEF